MLFRSDHAEENLQRVAAIDHSGFLNFNRHALHKAGEHEHRETSSSWVGYKTAYVEFEVHEREAGESKWSAWSLIKYAFTNIVAFTTAPLQFVSFGGGICFVCSLVMIIYSLIQYFRGHAIEGYTTTILLLLLIGSAIMLSLGVIGYYLAKIYEEVKRRPRYIVSQIIHGNKDVTGSVRDDA